MEAEKACEVLEIHSISTQQIDHSHAMQETGTEIILGSTDIYQRTYDIPYCSC
jgi:hypothetical protein